MCGIVGVAGDIKLDAEKAFKQLLIFDSIRGIDSTGVMAKGQGLNEDPIIAKQVGDPFQLMETPKFANLFKRNLQVLIGHNRYATVGKITRNTAHPFEFDNVIGVHNGTLDNKYQMPNGNNFDVDSQALYSAIDTLGPKEGIAKARGAWSLVWWNKEENSLNFLRNKERPMWIGTLEGGKTILYASEDWMIKVAAGRNNLKIIDMHEPKVDTLYSFGFNADSSIKLLKAEEGYNGLAPFQGNVQHLFPNGAANTNTTRQPKKNKGSIQEEVRSAYYSNKDGVEFVVTAIKKDERGAEYCLAQARNFPAIELRWFMHRMDKAENYLGYTFTGSIGAFHTGDMGSYYKLNYGSVKKLPKVARNENYVQRAIQQELLEEQEEEGKYLGAHGRMLTSKEWIATHGKCCWCSASTFPMAPHKFTKTGEVLCGDCSDDPEIQEYVQ